MKRILLLFFISFFIVLGCEWVNCFAAVSTPISALNIRDISDLKKRMLRDNIISKLCEDKRMLKTDAIQQRIKIATEYEKKFESYKRKLRQLSDDIISLNELRVNLNEQSFLKERRNRSIKEFDKEIAVYLENHADAYIPVIFASYIELPAEQHKRKYELMNQKLLKELIERYGIEKIIATDQLRNSKLVLQYVKSIRRGAVEQDGIRNFEEVDLTNWGIETHKCLKVGLYRFMPFAESPALYKKVTDQIQSKKGAFQFNCWSLENFSSVNLLKDHVQDNFADHEQYLKYLDVYLSSIGDIKDEIDVAEQRIKVIVERLKSKEKEHENKIKIENIKIQAITDSIINLKAHLGLSNADMKTINALIQKKVKEKKALERKFNYKFVMMAETKAANLNTAVRHSIERIFNDLENMINKQTMTIKTTIENGMLQFQDQKMSSYTPLFTNIFVQHYFAGNSAGVILVLDVQYQIGNPKSSSPPPSLPVSPQSPVSSPSTYVEKIKNSKILMVKLEGGNFGGTVYISESAVTKGQFDGFLKDTGIRLEDDPNFRCERIFRNYPADSTMPKKCVTLDLVENYIKWVNKNAVKNSEFLYRLSKEAHNNQAFLNGINTRRGFHIISEKRN